MFPTDDQGFGCALCGGSPSVRWEQCYINDDTKTNLLAHADELSTFGVTLQEQKSATKSVDKMEAIGLVLSIAESLHPGALRDLVLFLRDLLVPKEEILRLRLDEPEEISKILSEANDGEDEKE